MLLKNFSEFKALQGTTLEPSPWLQVEQKMIDHFAAATKDYQWIHVDQERAKLESPYKSTIAHGFLSIALIPQSRAMINEKSLSWAKSIPLYETPYPSSYLSGI